jgi:hypothetical protein
MFVSFLGDMFDEIVVDDPQHNTSMFRDDLNVILDDDVDNALSDNDDCQV